MAAAAVTVAMGLLVLWQWALVHTVRPATAVVAADSVPPVQQLTTPLLSVRRAPGVLARELSATSFVAALQPLVDQVGSSSCLAVAVDGRPVVSVNPMMPVVPGSNVKLAVAATAIELLGPNFTYVTRVAGTIGPGGVVSGDLALVGGGDPVLGTQAGIEANRQSHPPINLTRLEGLADAVVQAGVTRVDGRLVADGGRYDNEWFVPIWPVEIRGESVGPYGGLLVDDAGFDAAADPALDAGQVFVRLLAERGVTVAQGAVSATAPIDTEIASITSLPLTAIIEEMLQTSDNTTAEMVVKEIGLEMSGVGSTVAGLAAMTDQLRAWGLAVDGSTFFDGSGLSSSDRMTCDLLLGILHHGSPDDAVGSALPVAASSGTLADVFGGTSMAGRLRAKTGTLTGVKALSGYVPVDGGGTIEFSLVVNAPGINTGAYLPLWQKVLAPALATYPTGPTVAELAPR